MRSISVKLMLAFLLVSLIGVGLVALLISLRTRTEFARFLSERDQTALSEALTSYYHTNGSWAGVDRMLATNPTLVFARRGMVLADPSGVVVLGHRELRPGQRLSATQINASTPLSLDGQPIGMIVPAGPGDPIALNVRPPPETAFLERISTATATSAIVAAALALLLGAFLAQTLTRPIRELIAVTRTLARGTFDHRVRVRSRDEIGQLAGSFNQMSEDLARASMVRKQMTADLAHDLRTPLSILRGYTEGLKDERLAGSPTIYRVMHEEVEHLQRLVEDMCVLSLADAGELSLNRRAVDPMALLERTGLAYFVEAEERGIQLLIEPAENLPSIMVDTDRMTQVLKNLVSNALRYTAEGSIALSASVEGQQVLLRVRDSGSGIDPADLPFIFERLYRADKARTRGDSTTSGLGLAIVKAMVEAHGGSISAESQPGIGTTFTIALPVAAGAAVAAPQSL